MSVKNAILGLLAQRPRHGYDLRLAFEALAGGEQNWELKPAQVYSTLDRLLESGLIAEEPESSTGAPDKRIYCLTESGRAELESWFSTGIDAEHQRDEFFIKLMLSVAVTGIADPFKVIQVQRNKLYQDLHRLTTQRTEADPRSELAQILLMDKAVMHLEADLRWLDMIEGRLEEVRKQPLPKAQLRPRGRPRKDSG